MSLVVYDVEVIRGPDEVSGGWESPEGMGFSSAVTYSYDDDRYRFWLGPDDLPLLNRFLTGKTAISFNGIQFDSRVILGNGRILEPDGRVYLPAEKSVDKIWFDNYDILQEYIKSRFAVKTVGEVESILARKETHDGSFGLGGLARGTLKMDKIGSGALAPTLYREKKYGRLMAYNLHDVRLTRKLYDFIQKEHYLKDSSGRIVEMR